MIDQSNGHSPAKPNDDARKERFLVLALVAVVLFSVLGVYATIPRKLPEANVQTAARPTATELAIQDLKSSLQRADTQLLEIQRAQIQDKAEGKRLSEVVTALSNRLETMQQSIARNQQAPPIQPVEAARQSRGAEKSKTIARQ